MPCSTTIDCGYLWKLAISLTQRTDLIWKAGQKMHKLKTGKAQSFPRLRLYLHLGWAGDSRTNQKLRRDILKIGISHIHSTDLEKNDRSQSYPKSCHQTKHRSTSYTWPKASVKLLNIHWPLSYRERNSPWKSRVKIKRILKELNGNINSHIPQQRQIVQIKPKQVTEKINKQNQVQ